MGDFKQYIIIVKDKNKTIFAAEKVQIKPNSLENLLEHAFWAGFRHCEELHKLKEDTKFNDSFSDLFGNLFKK